MHNTLIHALSLLAVVTTTACVRENLQGIGLKSFDSFIATVEETSVTKTTMDESGGVHWAVGDCIGVFSDTQRPVPYYMEEDGRFRGSLVTGNVFYAYYPYDSFEYDSDYPTLLKPRSVGVAYNTNEVPMLMVAKTTGNLLTFKQTCGVLAFKIRSEQRILSLGIRSNQENQALWGDGTVNVDHDSPSMQLSIDGFHSYSRGVTVSTESEVPEDNWWYFYCPIPPLTMSDGFEISVSYYPSSDQNGPYYYSKSTQNSVSIGRGQMRVFCLEDPDRDLEEERQIFQEKQLIALREKNAVLAIYEALCGESWVPTWDVNRPLSLWGGIADENGRVVRLNISEPYASGSLPDVFEDLPELTTLNIYAPGMTGTLPASLEYCTKLREITITGSLNGTFPEVVRNLENLESLSISPFSPAEEKTEACCLTGPLPSWIGELQSLRRLYLSGNLLSGELPANLGDLTHLEQLFLNENAFTGGIPEELTSCSSLTWIGLDNNNLSGKVPSSFRTWAPWRYAWGTIMESNPLLDISEALPDYPEISVTLLDGESSWNSDQILDNELTILFQCASWCMHCNRIRPLLKAAYTQFKDRGLDIISWSNESQSAIEKDVLREGIEWKTFRVAMPDNLFGISYGWPIFAYPTVTAFDGDGHMVFSDCLSARDEIKDFLEDYFGEDIVSIGESYTSEDYSRDGQVLCLQTATEGAGIDLVLMGDGYVDREIADGTYRSDMENVMEAFFSVEPYKSYRDLFNVNMVEVVSANSGHSGEHTLETEFGEGTHISGNNATVVNYAKNAVDESQLESCTILVLINYDKYAGTCHMIPSGNGDYGQGVSVAYFTKDSDTSGLTGTILHEAGGHGFGKLGDEYSYTKNGTIPIQEKTYREAEVQYGWWKNIDFTNDPELVKWARFLNDSRYDSESLGCYEGGFTYVSGVWRPSLNSIMRHNKDGFNAPSRYAIWYRINKLAYGAEWNSTKTPEEIYEEFVTFDMSTRQQLSPASLSIAKHRSYVEKEFVPLAPPVIHEGSWRDLR